MTRAPFPPRSTIAPGELSDLAEENKNAPDNYLAPTPGSAETSRADLIEFDEITVSPRIGNLLKRLASL